MLSELARPDSDQMHHAHCMYGFKFDGESMRRLRQVVGTPKLGPWICSRCQRGRQISISQYGTYATKAQKTPLSKGSASTSKGPLPNGSISEETALNGQAHGDPRPKNSITRGRTRGIIFVVLGVGSMLAFSDSVQHGVAAATRTMRVVTTLALCVNE